MYEHRALPPISTPKFARRMVNHLLISVGLLVVSLGVGIGGYALFDDLPVIDGFVNAAMLLGGMGPVNMPVSTSGKLFSGIFALYSGLVFLISAAFIITPVAHRVLHKFHWDQKEP